MINRISRIPLRDIWKHEARDFTTWLQENIDILNEVIGVEILNAEREQSTGNFNVDITGEDASGHTVIIENQLERSNHDHLGKLITYLCSFDAKIAIWIVAEPRQEHINAIAWLNESTNVDFYLIKIEGVKIGDSDPAPLMTIITGPSEEAKSIGTIKKSKSERHKLRYKFWEQFLESSKSKLKTFNSISPSEYNWIGTGSGLRGVNYTFWLTKDGVSLKIYIDRGKDKDEENIDLFNQLIAQKNEIERDFGNELEWEELDGYRSCVIKFNLNSGGWKTEEEKWPIIHQEMIDSMLKLQKATKEKIKRLKLN